MSEESSLDLILNEAHRVLDVQLRHFEALDTRSGIILGFSGTLVAFASGGGVLVSTGRALAATAALIALLGLVARGVSYFDPGSLAVDYSAAGTEQTKAGLVALHGDLFALTERQIAGKTRRLRTATAILVVAIFCVAAGSGG